MPTELFLQYQSGDQSFIPVSAKNGSGIFLTLDEEKSIWLFQYTDDASFIARRTALRRANEIARVGYRDPKSGKKVGVNFKCEEDVDPYRNLPDLVKTGKYYGRDN